MNVLIVGGTRGIGKQTAIEFAKDGATVGITYRAEDEAAQQVKRQVNERGGVWAGAWKFNASSENAPQFYSEILQQMKRVDVLVHCAGITRDKTFKKMEYNQWADVIHVNLDSIFYSCKAVLPAMLEKNFGRIVLLSSVIGQSGGFGQTNYAASKAAMIGFVKSLARECAEGDVTVNTLCPGFVETDMTAEIPVEIKERILSSIPKKRFASAEEIACAIKFLSSPMAGYITGQAIGVNGGLYM